jgi:signal-transduction protein with cAMP-binding, CBS, and nucleotidyltransferase domain
MEPKSQSEPVSKFIYPKITVIASKLTINDAAKAMHTNNVESVLVFEGDHVIGIITERDILNEVVAKGLDPTKTNVAQIVKKPIIGIQKNEPVSKAIELMRENNIRRLVVFDDKRPLGIIRRKQLSGVLEVREILLPELENPSLITCPYCFSEFDDADSARNHIDKIHF